MLDAIPLVSSAAAAFSHTWSSLECGTTQCSGSRTVRVWAACLASPLSIPRRVVAVPCSPPDEYAHRAPHASESLVQKTWFHGGVEWMKSANFARFSFCIRSRSFLVPSSSESRKHVGSSPMTSPCVW